VSYETDPILDHTHKFTVQSLGTGAFLTIEFRKDEKHEWETDSHTWISPKAMAALATQLQRMSSEQLEHIADHKRKKAEIHGPPAPKKEHKPLPEWLARHPLFG
jgi:hypothetical protein